MGLIIVVLFSGCNSMPGTSRHGLKAITKQGEMSEVVLAHVQRQNYIQDGDRNYTHPDGLVFYFVIYPKNKNFGQLTPPPPMDPQNFTINGAAYWQDLAGTVDSYTVIYDEKTFLENEAALIDRFTFTQNAEALIQKTISCGEALPKKGTVEYVFYFGFEQQLEEFNFQFELRDAL
jgi:hypothetical protein